jgi:Uncharacterized alpha/beta hydrolase domain (DUF2235)
MKPESPERAAAKADLVAKYGNRPVTIAMIGVWDTVGALGIPSVVGGIDPMVYGFLDTKLSPSVLAAYHAISIDERRKAFPPTLWVSDNVPGQILEQVWFSGCHSGVGGGYPNSGRSDITLKWMLEKCVECGLTVDPTVLAKYTALDVAVHGLDAMQESWNVLWGLPHTRDISSDSAIANSVAVRLEHLTTYTPSNLTLTPTRGLASCYSAVTI